MRVFHEVSELIFGGDDQYPDQSGGVNNRFRQVQATSLTTAENCESSLFGRTLRVRFRRQCPIDRSLQV